MIVVTVDIDIYSFSIVRSDLDSGFPLWGAMWPRDGPDPLGGFPAILGHVICDFSSV